MTVDIVFVERFPAVRLPTDMSEAEFQELTGGLITVEMCSITDTADLDVWAPGWTLQEKVEIQLPQATTSA